jgi:hypothetical protein
MTTTPREHVIWVRPESEMASRACGMCKGTDDLCPYCCKVVDGQYIGPMERKGLPSGSSGLIE